MSAYELTHHPAVAHDLWQALVWYARIDPRISTRFVEEFWTVVNRVRESPEHCAADHCGKRRARLHGFPYMLIYELHGETVHVLCLSHGSRNPEFWGRRQ